MIYTVGGTMTNIFSPSGEGAPVSAIVCLSVAGGLIGMVASALGHGMTTKMIDIIIKMLCIGIVLAVVKTTLGSLGISF